MCSSARNSATGSARMLRCREGVVWGVWHVWCGVVCGVCVGGGRKERKGSRALGTRPDAAHISYAMGKSHCTRHRARVGERGEGEEAKKINKGHGVPRTDPRYLQSTNEENGRGRATVCMYTAFLILYG